MKKIVLGISILISSMIGADVTNSIGMVFKEIPASKGMKSFYMAQTEVTQAQWVKVMGSNPSFFQSKMYNLPVDSIDVKSVLEFIKRLNLKENTKAYRLPTIEEFEYLTDGMCMKPNAGDFAVLSDMLDHSCIRSSMVLNQKTPNAVQTRQPNKYGVHDLYGNVRELTVLCEGQTCEAFIVGDSWADDRHSKFMSFGRGDPQIPITPAQYFELIFLPTANKGFNQSAPIDLGFRIVKDKQ